MSLPVAVIDKLAFGGSGICRIDGKVCFVPFSCPDDKVLLNITSQKKSYCTAEISELISPSSARIVPECPVFGLCGGCNWQNIGYSIQLEQKRLIFSDILWRGARVAGELIKDVVASTSCYGYRSRVQFKVHVGQGRLQIGFFRHGSHSVEDVSEGCPIAVPQINEILKSFRSVLLEFSELDAISQISVDVSDKDLIAVVHFAGQDIRKIRSFLIEHADSLKPCTGIFLQTVQSSSPEHLWGATEIGYAMPGRNSESNPYFLTYRPGGFAQVNQNQNVALLHLIRQLGDFSGTENLLDLYCGNGNFSIPLSADVASVVGIEGSEESIDSAERNRVANCVNNVEFICGDVCTGLRRLISDGRTFDVILIDPPRTGAGDAVPDIVRLSSGRIVYVSCDPNTLARDCGLLAGYGFRVAESVPLDMFPQTYHLESATLLVKT